MNRDDDSRNANDGLADPMFPLSLSTYLTLIDRYIATVSHSIHLLLIIRLYVGAM